MEEIERMLIGQLPDLRDTKAGRDPIARGEELGLEKGLEEGLGIGELRLIQTVQSILRQPISTEEELSEKDLVQLRLITESLQKQFGTRPM
jgi:hypothetical protein